MRSTSKLPDPGICITRPVANDVWECLVAEPGLCPFLSRFGNGFYCNNPENGSYKRKERGKKKPLGDRNGEGENV